MTTDLSGVTRPIQTARGLPNGHYIDPAVHAEEREALLFDEWAGIGVAADVPSPGDARPIDFLGVPLLVLRDRAGVVRVFHNICRHRGMILVSEPRQIRGAIRCPYHSWCYGTDGRLVATPHVGGPGRNSHDGIDRDTLGLIEVPSHIWRDVIFVNLNANAPPFAKCHADLMQRWSEFSPTPSHGGPGSRFTLTVTANWKLAVENYCESYHLPWVHPGLNAYSRLEDHYNIQSTDPGPNHPAPPCPGSLSAQSAQPTPDAKTAGGRFSGQGTLVYRQIHDTDGAVFPDFPNLSDHWNEGAEYIAIYPNVLLGVQRDHAFAIVLLPLAQNKTEEHIHLYYATDDTRDDLRRANAAQWKTVFEEDIFVVEGMQKGRNAPGFDGGRFSPAMDGPTHCFHEWVADKICAHRQKLAAE